MSDGYRWPKGIEWQGGEDPLLVDSLGQRFEIVDTTVVDFELRGEQCQLVVEFDADGYRTRLSVRLKSEEE